MIASIFAWTWKDFGAYTWSVKRPNILTWFNFPKGYRGPSNTGRKRACLPRSLIKREPQGKYESTLKFTKEVKPVFSGTHIYNYLFYCLKPLLNRQTNYVTSFNMPGTKFWLYALSLSGQCIAVIFLQAFIQKLGYQYRFMTGNIFITRHS